VFFNDTPAEFTIVNGGQVDVIVPNIAPGVYVIHAVLAPEVGRASYWDGYTVTSGAPFTPGDVQNVVAVERVNGYWIVRDGQRVYAWSPETTISDIPMIHKGEEVTVRYSGVRPGEVVRVMVDGIELSQFIAQAPTPTGRSTGSTWLDGMSSHTFVMPRDVVLPTGVATSMQFISAEGTGEVQAMVANVDYVAPADMTTKEVSYGKKSRATKLKRPFRSDLVNLAAAAPAGEGTTVTVTAYAGKKGKKMVKAAKKRAANTAKYLQRSGYTGDIEITVVKKAKKADRGDVRVTLTES